jgi:hypothetical protein
VWVETHAVLFCSYVGSLAVSVAVAAVNIAVETQDSRNLLSCLQNKALNLHSVTSSCASEYLEKLADFKQRKAQAGNKLVFESGGLFLTIDLMLQVRRVVVG